MRVRVRECACVRWFFFRFLFLCVHVRVREFENSKISTCACLPMLHGIARKLAHDMGVYTSVYPPIYIHKYLCISQLSDADLTWMPATVRRADV